MRATRIDGVRTRRRGSGRNWFDPSDRNSREVSRFRPGSVAVPPTDPSFLEHASCGVFTANNNEPELPVHYGVPVQPDRVVTS